MKIINTKTNLLKKLLYTLISLNSNIFGAYNQPIEEIEETNNELSLEEQIFLKFQDIDNSLTPLKHIYEIIEDEISDKNKKEIIDIKNMFYILTNIIEFMEKFSNQEMFNIFMKIPNNKNYTSNKQYNIIFDKKLFESIITNTNFILSFLEDNENIFKRLIKIKTLILNTLKKDIAQLYENIEKYLDTIKEYMELKESDLNKMITSESENSKLILIHNLRIEILNFESIKIEQKKKFEEYKKNLNELYQKEQIVKSNISNKNINNKKRN